MIKNNIDLSDLVFQNADQPLIENRYTPISWGDYMDEIEPFVNQYLMLYDSPEERLKSKSLERFVWKD